MSTIHSRLVVLLSSGLVAGFLWVLLGVLPAGFPGGNSGVARADDTVQAVWKHQELNYTYQGFTSTYTCDGLRDRVRTILLALGANKDDLRLSSSGCIGLAPSPAPSLRIQVSMAVPATSVAAAAQAEAQAPPHRHKAKILSTAPFPATWQTISLAPRPTGVLQIEMGDCELVEQLRDRLFPKLGVKVVRNNVSCIPHQLTLGQPDLQVQVLVPVKQAG